MLQVLRNLKISARIMLALVLPLIGLLGVSGYVLMEKRQTVSDLEHLGALSEFATRVSVLIHELQKERGASAVYQGSNGEKLADVMAEQRSVADAARVSFNGFLTGFDAAQFGPEFGKELDEALADLRVGIYDQDDEVRWIAVVCHAGARGRRPGYQSTWPGASAVAHRCSGPRSA